MKRIIDFSKMCMLTGGTAEAANARSEVELWPETKPFQSGHLQVSDIHRIYYETSGNPHGTPVFFLHGGPGGSSSPRMRRMADPDRFLIVQHDQRGAGRSEPAGELRENTTQALVADVERLRRHLQVEDVILVGGSWGTTLALAYAEAYPQHVAGLVLRGVFTATEKEIDHIFHGGAAAFFPQAYQEFLCAMPDRGIRPLPSYLYRLMREGNNTTKRKLSRAFVRYTLKISELQLSDKEVEETLDAEDLIVTALFESFYMAHHAFLEDDQIMRDIEKISHIPSVIINGRYDLICPPETAFRLHKRMHNSALVIVESAGHSMSEPGVERAVLEAIASI